MKSLIFKEIRECSLICLLGLIALGAVMAGALSYFQPPDYSLPAPLLTSMFHASTAFGYPALGVCLGFAQVIVDRRRGRWDFLIHRPMSPTRIFIAKALIGSTLCLLTGIIPLAIATVWVATPGHVAAPFDWHMILPPLADLFSGLVWYAAGMLVAARQARWIGSRIMPLAVALIASMLAFVWAMNFTEALAYFAVALAILFPAAWAAFVFGGEYEPQPLVARFLQGVSIEPGVALALMAGTGLLVGIIEFAHGGGQKPHYAVSYQVDVSGQIDRTSERSDGQMQWTDLNGRGRPLSQTEFNPASSAYLPFMNFASEDMPRSIRVGDMGLHGEERYGQYLTYSSTVFWYYVASRRTIEGYDSETRRYVGSIGPGGFAGAALSPQPFPEPLQDPGRNGAVFFSRTAAYSFHPREWKISRIFISGADDPILWAGPIYGRSGQQSELIKDNVVVTNSTLHIVRNGQELFHVPLEHSYPPYTGVYVYSINGGRFIFLYGGAYLPGNGLIPGDWIVESDEHGKILSRQQMPAQRQEINESNLEDTAAVLAVPPTLAIYKEAIGHATMGIVDSCAVALASALTNLLLLRQFKPRPRMKITWTLIALLMGISGILLLLSLRQRMASIRCPSCAKPRLVSEELCPHCRAPFDPPPPLGIEIFELA